MTAAVRVTRADFEDAAVRIAERDGVTVATVRERVRAGGILARTGVCPACGETFVAEREGATYCSGKCRSQFNRERIEAV